MKLTPMKIFVAGAVLILLANAVALTGVYSIAAAGRKPA